MSHFPTFIVINYRIFAPTKGVLMSAEIIP